MTVQIGDKLSICALVTKILSLYRPRNEHWTYFNVDNVLYRWRKCELNWSRAYIIYIARPKKRDRERERRKAQTTFRLRNDMFEPSFTVSPIGSPPWPPSTWLMVRLEVNGLTIHFSTCARERSTPLFARRLHTTPSIQESIL